MLNFRTLCDLLLTLNRARFSTPIRWRRSLRTSLRHPRSMPQTQPQATIIFLCRLLLPGSDRAEILRRERPTRRRNTSRSLLLQHTRYRDRRFSVASLPRHRVYPRKSSILTLSISKHLRRNWSSYCKEAWRKLTVGRSLTLIRGEAIWRNWERGTMLLR